MGRIQCDFEGGVLTLRGRLRTHRFRWEPAPLAEVLEARDRWIEAWPPIRLFSPRSGGPAPVAAFRGTLPAGLVAAVERFPKHQWSLLVLLHAQAYARDLERTCPVLAFCVANSQAFRGTTPEQAAALAQRHVRQPRREIAGWLGFPAVDSTVRILSRIRPEAATTEGLVGLRTALAGQPGLARLLMHVPSINAGVLFFAARGRLAALATYPLLAELAADPDELEHPPTGSLLIDALRMLAEIDPLRRVRPFRSADRIRRFHEETVREHLDLPARRARERAAIDLRRRRLQEAEARRMADARHRPDGFPAPPIAGTDTIHPLVSTADLVRESREQINCLWHQGPSVKEARAYYYRVTAPSRATVSISFGPDGLWRIGQIRGPRNASVPPATRKAVEHWLDEAQRG
ncbi:MAG: hypothetical protein FJ221_12095 [Lentisphaerae bacterium]|nr:hypothetical protein [Lentisphaerota bacterium]